MEEPLFPFFSHGDEQGRQHCYDCFLPLPEDGDAEVILVPVQGRDGVWQLVPACRRHWYEAARGQQQ